MADGSENQGNTQAKRVVDLLCQGHCVVAPRQSLVRIAKTPQRPRPTAAAHYPSVLPIEERRGTVLLGIVERHPLDKVRERRGDRAQVEQARSQDTMRCYEQGNV